MELQGDTGHILLTYYGKYVNIMAGRKGGGPQKDEDLRIFILFSQGS